MGMANSVNAIKGTFTVQSIDNVYTINIGRALANYLFYVEMTPQSIARLSQTDSSTTRKTYAMIGINQFPEIGGGVLSGRALGTNYRTSDGARSVLAFTVTCTDNSIRFLAVADDYTQMGCYLYEGYTYNYTIIPID